MFKIKESWVDTTKDDDWLLVDKEELLKLQQAALPDSSQPGHKQVAVRMRTCSISRNEHVPQPGKEGI